MRSSAVTHGEHTADAIRALQPSDDFQRAMLLRAESLAETLLEGRWLGVAAGARSVPTALLIALTFWLTITFGSFGLFAPNNGIVFTALCLAALAVAVALFLVLEMESPFDGIIKASPDPLI